MQAKHWIITGALFAAAAVALGAFGAHGLSATLTANGRAATFDTAVQYHMMHALGLLIAGLLAEHLPARIVRVAGWAFVAGIALFSGSLYALAISNAGFFGAIAPLGGAAFIIGWLALTWGAWQRR